MGQIKIGDLNFLESAFSNISKIKGGLTKDKLKVDVDFDAAFDTDVKVDFKIVNGKPIAKKASAAAGASAGAASNSGPAKATASAKVDVQLT